MTQDETNNVQTRTVIRRDESFLESTVSVAGGAARFGMNVLMLPLELLPRETRGHMRNAMYELSHAFARLPAEFAGVAGAEIEKWVEEERTTRRATEATEALGAAMATASAPAAAPKPAAPTSPPTAQPAAPSPAAPAQSASQPAAAPKPVAPTSAPAAQPAAPSPAAPAPQPAPQPTAAPKPASPPQPAAAPKPTAPGPQSAAQPAAAPKPAVPAAAPQMAKGIAITYIEFDPPGRDIDGEYVRLRNSSGQPITMTGWKLRDEGAKHTYTFPTFILTPGAEVQLWTKSGKNDAANLYWGNPRPIWNNTGDTAVLLDASGKEVTKYTYEGKK